MPSALSPSGALALLQREWAGIEKASSHRQFGNLLTEIIHMQKQSMKIARKIAGYAAPSTTRIYEHKR